MSSFRGPAAADSTVSIYVVMPDLSKSLFNTVQTCYYSWDKANPIFCEYHRPTVAPYPSNQCLPVYFDS